MNLFSRMIAAAVVTAAVLSPAAVWAHAQLDHASPTVGSKVASAPTQVQIWFDQEVNPAGTSIEVFDSAGKEIDLKDSKQDTQDHSLMVVNLPRALASGTYTVKWKALCMQGHKTQGEFKFTVGR